MPDDSYGLEFTADVRDFQTKAQEVTDGMNKVAAAIERVNSAGRQRRSGGIISPYREEASRQRKELKAMQEAGFYSQDALEKQKRKVDALHKKDMAFEKSLYSQQQAAIKEAEMAKKKSQTEARREELAWQRWSRMVLRQDKEEKRQERREEAKHQREQHQRETVFRRGMMQIGRATRRVLGHMGLGRVGAMLDSGSQAASGISTALGATTSAATGTGILAMIGTPLQAVVKTIIAGVAGFGAATVWGAKKALSHNPALQYDKELAGYVNPAEAMDKTRLLLKGVVAWEKIKTRFAMETPGIIEKVLLGSTAVLQDVIKGVSGGRIQPTMLEESKEYVDDLKKQPTLGELRYWIEQGKQALGPGGPSSDLGAMGLYASSTEGVRMNRQDITMSEMISSMKNMTGAMTRLTERGIMVDMGAANSSLAR